MERITKNSSGFTLIEVLIVIVIVGVMAAGVAIAVDPIDKIKSANDAKAQNNVGVVARAAEAYAVTHNGFYPSNDTTGLIELRDSGDLKIIPTMPSGGGVSYSLRFVAPAADVCASGGTAGCTKVVIYSELYSKRFGSVNFYTYSSTTGQTCLKATTPNISTTCP